MKNSDEKFLELQLRNLILFFFPYSFQLMWCVCVCKCLRPFSFVKDVLQFHDDSSYYGSLSVHYSSHSEALHSRNISCGQFSCFMVVLFCTLFLFSLLMQLLLICHWTLSIDFASLIFFLLFSITVLSF